MTAWRILSLLFVICGYLLVGVYLRIWYLLRSSLRHVQPTTAFERSGSSAQLRILVAGDSLAVGVGASLPDKSLAGHLGRIHADAAICNVGISGARVCDLAAQLERVAYEHFDLVIIVIGGNDVTSLTLLDDVRRDVSHAVVAAKRIADRVILTSFGDVGRIPKFWYPFRRAYHASSVAMRDMFAQVALEHGIDFVDFLDPEYDPTTDPERYLSGDGVHPNDAGYARYGNVLLRRLHA